MCNHLLTLLLHFVTQAIDRLKLFRHRRFDEAQCPEKIKNLIYFPPENLNETELFFVSIGEEQPT